MGNFLKLLILLLAIYFLWSFFSKKKKGAAPASKNARNPHEDGAETMVQCNLCNTYYSIKAPHNCRGAAGGN